MKRSIDGDCGGNRDGPAHSNRPWTAAQHARQTEVASYPLVSISKTAKLGCFDDAGHDFSPRNLMSNQAKPEQNVAGPSALPRAIVLAAGKGTRMKSDLPKVLCEAAGRPLIEYVLEALRSAGIGRFIVVVGYRGDLVQQRLADWPDIEFVEQTEQLGTGHAVMMCRDQLAEFDGPVVIVAGDSPMLQAASIKQLLDDYQQTQAACILGTLEHEDPQGLGRIVRDPAGKFVGIVEEKDCSPQQRLIREVNMSTYLIASKPLLQALSELTDQNSQGEYYITDVPGILIGKGCDVRALPVLQPCEALSVNTVEQLKLVEQEMLKNKT